MDAASLFSVSDEEYAKDVSQDSVFVSRWLNITGTNPGLGLLAWGRVWCSPPRFTKKERGIMQEGDLLYT